jgi:hypothetical protein
MRDIGFDPTKTLVKLALISLQYIICEAKCVEKNAISRFIPDTLFCAKLFNLHIVPRSLRVVHFFLRISATSKFAIFKQVTILMQAWLSDGGKCLISDCDAPGFA